MGFYYTKWNGVLQRTLVLRHFLTTKALQNDPRNIKTTTSFLSPASLNPPPKKLVCADSGANKTLVRESDAIAAELTIHLTSHPLVVQFPDGVIARSTGIAEVALPATDIEIPAHVISDDMLNPVYWTLLTKAMMLPSTTLV